VVVFFLKILTRFLSFVLTSTSAAEISFNGTFFCLIEDSDSIRCVRCIHHVRIGEMSRSFSEFEIQKYERDFEESSVKER